MAGFTVISDSCSDYTDQADLGFIRRVPMLIHLEDTVYTDDEQLDCDALLRHMLASPEAPRSACSPPDAWAAAFDEANTDVYVVTLSAELSGSYNGASVAAQEYMEQHPEKHIHVFNSRSAAAGQVIICLKAKELAEQGLPFAEVVQRTEAFIDTMQTFFVLETLDVFRKNGRLSRIQSLAVGALRLKMVMHGTPIGYIEPVAKALSVQQALHRMVRIIEEQTKSLPDVSSRTLVITYVNCYERAAAVRDAVLAVCPFGSAVLCRGSGISTIYANNGGIVLSY